MAAKVSALHVCPRCGVVFDLDAAAKSAHHNMEGAYCPVCHEPADATAIDALAHPYGSDHGAAAKLSLHEDAAKGPAIGAVLTQADLDGVAAQASAAASAAKQAGDTASKHTDDLDAIDKRVAALEDAAKGGGK